MKKVLPYLLLLIYTTILLKPVLPYVTDIAEHILNFEGHMAKVHAHNGKYHVHNEVAEGTKNDNSEKNTDSLLKKGTSFPEHIISRKSDIISLLKIKMLYPAEFTEQLNNIFLPGNYPPPKA